MGPDESFVLAGYVEVDRYGPRGKDFAVTKVDREGNLLWTWQVPILRINR